VPQEYAVSNAPRVSLNPLSDEHQAMRGRGEGGDAHKLTGSITQASQKSLEGLALGRDGRGELEISALWKERSEAFYSMFLRDREQGKWSARPQTLGQPALQWAKQQCCLPQRAAQALSGPLSSLSNGSHQLNGQAAKSCNFPAVHTHALLQSLF